MSKEMTRWQRLAMWRSVNENLMKSRIVTTANLKSSRMRNKPFRGRLLKTVLWLLKTSLEVHSIIKLEQLKAIQTSNLSSNMPICKNNTRTSAINIASYRPNLKKPKVILDSSQINWRNCKLRTNNSIKISRQSKRVKVKQLLSVKRPIVRRLKDWLVKSICLMHILTVSMISLWRFQAINKLSQLEQKSRKSGNLSNIQWNLCEKFAKRQVSTSLRANVFRDNSAMIDWKKNSTNSFRNCAPPMPLVTLPLKKG